MQNGQQVVAESAVVKMRAMPASEEHNYTAAEWSARGPELLAAAPTGQVSVDGLVLKFSRFRSDYELHCFHGEQLYFHFRFKSREDLVACAVAVGIERMSSPTRRRRRHRGAFPMPAIWSCSASSNLQSS